MMARSRPSSVLALTLGLSLGISAVASSGVDRVSASPLAVDTARVVISGTSNIHPYTASTAAVRLVQARTARNIPPAEFWQEIVKPGALETFDVALSATSLQSSKDGLDKNMHKALKADKFPEVMFVLSRFDAARDNGLKAVGMLVVAGVSRDVTFDLDIEHRGGLLAVKGRTQLLMTDFGIAPPKAMLGMLKTDPKVTVTFEAVLSIPVS